MKTNLTIKNYGILKRIKQISFVLPSDWEEVPEKHFFELYYLLPFVGEKWAQTKILSLFLKPKYIHFLPNSFYTQTFIPEISKLKAVVTTAPFTKLSLSNKKIDIRFFGKDFSIKLPFKNNYYLPKAHLQNLTFGELAAGLKQIIIFFNKEGQNAEKNLNSAISIFCRPQKAWLLSFSNKNYRRTVFEIEDTEQIAADFSSIPYPTKLFVVNYVLGNLDLIKQAPKLKILFPTVVETEEKKEATDFGESEIKKTTKKDPSIWYDFIINIAETGLCGTFKEVQKSNFIEVLMIAAKKQQDLATAEMNRKMNQK